MTEIASPADLRPGDIGFGPIHGAAGLLVRAGQLLLAERMRLGTVSVDHVFVVTDAAKPSIPMGPMCVEAMPSGARWVSISNRWTDEYVYVRLSMPTGQQFMVAGEAKKLIGTPYSFLDYAALAMRHRGLSAVSPAALRAWIRNRVTDSGHMICSQLADQALSRAGVKVFTDGRLSQDVTPGALLNQLVKIGGTMHFPASQVGERLL